MDFYEVGLQSELGEEDLMEYFSIKLDHYKAIVKSLSEIQKGLVVIVLIALLLVFFGAEKLTFFGYTVPKSLAFIIIFFGGQYIWANFGLTLNAMIENRLSLHAYIDIMEGMDGGINYKNSLRHVLSDSTLGDNWFGHYFDIYQGRDPKPIEILASKAIGWLGLYGIYAIILGIFKFSLIAATLVFMNRHANTIPDWLRNLMPIFLTIMLMVCTLAFVFKVAYSAIWMGTIWMVNSIALFLWDSSVLGKASENRKLN
ncbi:MAG: hypothetical protein Tsb004_12780 [Allomuricauda sp.]